MNRFIFAELNPINLRPIVSFDFLFNRHNSEDMLRERLIKINVDNLD